MQILPVCGMTVGPHKAAVTAVYNGITYTLSPIPLPGEVSR